MWVLSLVVVAVPGLYVQDVVHRVLYWWFLPGLSNQPGRPSGRSTLAEQAWAQRSVGRASHGRSSLSAHLGSWAHGEHCCRSLTMVPATHRQGWSRRSRSPPDRVAGEVCLRWCTMGPA